MELTSTSTVKAFHSRAMALVNARWPLVLRLLGISRRRSLDATALVVHSLLLQGTVDMPGVVGVAVLHLGRVQNSKSTDSSSMLQTVQAVARSVAP